MTGKMTTPPVYLPNKPLGLQATYLCEPIQWNIEQAALTNANREAENTPLHCRDLAMT